LNIAGKIVINLFFYFNLKYSCDLQILVKKENIWLQSKIKKINNFIVEFIDERLVDVVPCSWINADQDDRARGLVAQVCC